jgi:hypothetical protein
MNFSLLKTLIERIEDIINQSNIEVIIEKLFKKLQILLVLILIMPILIWGTGRLMIESTASSLKTNDQLTTAININSWVYSEMRSNNVYQDKKHLLITTRSFTVYWLPHLPYICIRTTFSFPEWIILNKCGACGENSALFTALSRSAGLETMKVCNPGEDHCWAEVKINNTWHIFDPVVNEVYGTDFGVYERPKSEGGWGKNLSYVYGIDEIGVRYDLTKKYTDTGRLIIKVMKDGEPQADSTVIIFSKFLESNPLYGIPLESLRNRTNTNGTMVTELGGNDYLVVAEKKNGLFKWIGEANITVIENNETSVILNLERRSLNYDAIIIALYLIGGFLIGLGFGYMINEWKKYKKALQNKN